MDVLSTVSVSVAANDAVAATATSRSSLPVFAIFDAVLVQCTEATVWFYDSRQFECCGCGGGGSNGGGGSGGGGSGGGGDHGDSYGNAHFLSFGRR